MAQLQGKTVVVTGAARGLGRAMAGGLVAAGANVVGVDLPGQSELEATAKALGERFLALGANITDAAECARIVETAKGRFGAVHALVNNAGVGQQFINAHFASKPTRFWELTPEQYRNTIETNATSQFLMARAVVPSMIAQKWGRIVNVTTSFATMLLPGFTPYGPSKASAEALTCIMAKDLAGSGVTANVLIPGGAANTRMITDLVAFPDASKLVQPQKMVAPIVWLASNESNGVTGRRFIAQIWDETLPPSAAASMASGPVAWA